MKFPRWTAMVLSASMAAATWTACDSGNQPQQRTNPTNGTGSVPFTGSGGVVDPPPPVAGSTGGMLQISGSGGSNPQIVTGGIANVTGGIIGGNTGGTSGTVDVPPVGTDCGMRAGMRGKTSRSVMVGNTARTFIAYLPPMASATTPLPFVYVFHGASQTGQMLYDMTEYAKLADSEGIAVVFPDGQGASSATGTGSLAPWSVTDGPLLCGAGALVSNANASDFNFVDAIREDIKQDQCIDDAHVFATGFSMGGYFSHHIACDRPDFRAAAPHSGGTMGDLSTCKTTRMPIIIFHGTADLLIADNCDDPAATPDASFTASATLWAMRNGCQPTYTTVATNGANGSNGSCYVYDGCPADGQVEMCAFQGMSHCWAGASVCEGCIGTGPDFASATQLEWDFFKKYAW